jgi:hypothetical protein
MASDIETILMSIRTSEMTRPNKLVKCIYRIGGIRRYAVSRRKWLAAILTMTHTPLFSIVQSNGKRGVWCRATRGAAVRNICSAELISPKN